MWSNHHLTGRKPLDSVIFDLDDTLLNWAQPQLDWPAYLAPVIRQVHQSACSQGVQLPDLVEFGQVFGGAIRRQWQEARQTLDGVSLAGTLYHTFVEVGVDPEEIDASQLLRAVEWRPMPGVVPFDDALHVLDQLRKDGIKIGLITNAFQPMWMRDAELELFGLADRIDARITSGDTGFIKPHPAVFWRMCGLLRTTPDRAMYVGDSPEHDVRGANRVGMTSVWYRPPHLDRTADGDEPDYVIDKLSDLLPIVAALS